MVTFNAYKPETWNVIPLLSARALPRIIALLDRARANAKPGDNFTRFQIDALQLRILLVAEIERRRKDADWIRYQQTPEYRELREMD